MNAELWLRKAPILAPILSRNLSIYHTEPGMQGTWTGCRLALRTPVLPITVFKNKTWLLLVATPLVSSQRPALPSTFLLTTLLTPTDLQLYKVNIFFLARYLFSNYQCVFYLSLYIANVLEWQSLHSGRGGDCSLTQVLSPRSSPQIGLFAMLVKSLYNF